MDKLIPLGDPDAVVCEGDVCEVPGLTAPRHPAG
jgi:hypothetical protein